MTDSVNPYESPRSLEESRPLEPRLSRATRLKLWSGMWLGLAIGSSPLPVQIASRGLLVDGIIQFVLPCLFALFANGCAVRLLLIGGRGQLVFASVIALLSVWPIARFARWGWYLAVA